MTEKLYYADSYLTEFSARVVSCDADMGAYLVRLTRSAFYPTSGGQPFDTGIIGGAAVSDVFVTPDGDVAHRVNKPLAVGDTVTGQIDWARRFDHMQQHAGEHMIANALYRLQNGFTIGLHLGQDVSTIDVALPGGAMRVSDKAIFEIEDDVNARVQADVPIRCWFPEPDELAALPLRKPPAVSEHVRVVKIGELEYCACGGTHPSSAGQIGLIKIVDARPSKGKMRVSFLCGMRAFLDYRARMIATRAAAEALSTQWTLLPEAVENLNGRLHDAHAKVNALAREGAMRDVPNMLRRAAESNGIRVVKEILPDADMRVLRDVAAAIAQNARTIALIAAPSEAGYLLVFARSADAPGDMGRLLSESVSAAGGRGGGKPDFAQGGAPDARALDFALTQIIC